MVRYERLGIIYDLQQKDSDNDIDWSALDDYIEFERLLYAISDFSKDTPHIVAQFLYDDGNILNLAAYNPDIDYDEITGGKVCLFAIEKSAVKTYYTYNPKDDEYTEEDKPYIEWFFIAFLNSKRLEDFYELTGYKLEDSLYFKKTDILTLDCLRKIGFVDLSLLDEIDELKKLEREIKEKNKIIENLSNTLSNKINIIDEKTHDITNLTQQLQAKDAIIAEQAKLIAELKAEQDTGWDELTGIAKHNYDKKKAKGFARAIAKSIWKMDTAEQIRTDDMVQYIKCILLEASPKDLPEKNESLANWLKDIKPSYAAKSGRTPKNAPTEILLTFEK